MRMWEGFHHDRKVPVIVRVEYDEETGEYIVEVIRGYDTKEITFEPKHEPKEGLMHISDVERAVKIANKIIKDLKSEARKK